MRRAALAAAFAVYLAAVVAVPSVWAAARYLAATPPAGERPLVLLVLGSDEGPPRAGSPLTGRADGFQVVFVSPDRRHVTIVGIPRDSYVDVPGRGRTKINACLVHGPERCVETVRQLMGVEVDAWFVAGFRSFVWGVEGLGGVTVDVERRLHDPAGAKSDLQPGRQRLDGTQALAFVRDRKSRPDHDFGRSGAQGEFLRAVHRQLVAEQPSLARIGQLVALFRQTTETNASPQMLLQLALLAFEIPPENVGSIVLDGRTGRAGQASVVFLTDAAMTTIADLRADGRLSPPGG